MNSLKKNIKKPARLILKEIDFQDTIEKKVHRGGNKNKDYGRIYLPEEWIGKKVYVGLVKDKK